MDVGRVQAASPAHFAVNVKAAYGNSLALAFAATPARTSSRSDPAQSAGTSPGSPPGSGSLTFITAQ